MEAKMPIEVREFTVSRFTLNRILYARSMSEWFQQIIRASRGCLIYLAVITFIGFAIYVVMEPDSIGRLLANLLTLGLLLLILAALIILVLLGIGFLNQYLLSMSSQPYTPKDRIFIDFEYITMKGAEEEERYRLAGLHHVERVQKHLIIFLEENSFVIIPENIFTPSDLMRVQNWLQVAGKERKHDPQNPTAHA